MWLPKRSLAFFLTAVCVSNSRQDCIDRCRGNNLPLHFLVLRR